MEHAYSNDNFDEAAEVVWKALFGLGSVAETLAYSQAAQKFVDAGWIKNHPPQPGTEDDDFIRTSIETARSYDFIDSPQPGHVRAILRFAYDYELEDWERCIIGFMGENEGKGLGRDEIIKGAMSWAKENLGLQQTRLHQKSEVWIHLETALNQTIKDKIVKQTVFYGVERLRLAE